jgi:hypothetical protein
VSPRAVRIAAPILAACIVVLLAFLAPAVLVVSGITVIAIAFVLRIATGAGFALFGAAASMLRLLGFNKLSERLVRRAEKKHSLTGVDKTA